ncbi:hypothetical protein CPB84DRAFT_1716684 [Gymnopilus junonius]|uniref:Nephrocystin 3-like N-terminal domain-containing protein n=1 Tax=Gymnopilus junonius TaxID=109634 RepID=A0A9P5N7F7_GYMJU|nr:hypothetical protein CPB84DRAFT_1716684 [Gymnopilus junonius]
MEILDWARSGIEAPQFFWMYGSPGAGKTFSSRSIAQMLINDGMVVASFFFSRSVPARKNAFRLIATIAYQLSTVIPEICEPMALAIAREPTIFSRSLSIQLDTLIVSPLAHIAQLPSSKNLTKTIPQFIVLDGLDECEDMNSILELLSGIASKSQLPLVKFLITSRQELEIQNFFNEPTISPSSLRCSLDDQYRWNPVVHSQTQGAQQQTMLGILQQHIAPMAIYNSSERFNAPRCLPGTRTHIISEILYWADNDSKKYPFLWIYGPAGTGKSSVSQTIAEILFERGKLSASHFFSRVRMDATRFVATAAYQLSLSIPAFREPLEKAIENDPTIFSKSIQAQFESLIVEPFMHLSKDNDQRSSTNATAGIIIIDALDECENSENQNMILSVLFNAIQRSVLPLSFMIASRPEYSTRAFFDQVEVQSLTRRINLHIETRLEEDIEMFLRSEFQNIRETHPTKSSLQDWPSDTAIKQLVLKSSGQFIYASSVMKFIRAQDGVPENNWHYLRIEAIREPSTICLLRLLIHPPTLLY